jgi:FkbM family methyltransferase
MAFVNVKGRSAPFQIIGVSDQDPYIHGFLDPHGEHEKSFQTFCRNYLPRDAVALDIGANIGVTSLVMSAHLCGGEVHAVEGAENVYKTLESNLAANGVSNVTPHRLAISDSTRMVRFVDNSAYGHIADSFDGDKKSDAVEAITLDDLVERIGLERLDFIKVDIEGHEPQLFSGAQKTIARFDPIILFELNSWAMLVNTDVNPLDFLRQVVSQFKYVYRVCRDPNDRSGIEPIVSDVEGVARWLLHDNVVHFGSVNDVVVSNRPLVYTEEQSLRDQVEHLSDRIAQLEAHIADRDQDLATVRAALAIKSDEHQGEKSRREAEAAKFAEAMAAVRTEMQHSEERHAINQARHAAEATVRSSQLEMLQSELANRLSEEADLRMELISTRERISELSGEMGAAQHMLEVFRVRAEALDGDWSWRTAHSLRSAGQLPPLPGPALSDTDYINGLFRHLLGREADQAGLATYVRRLALGRSRKSVLADILASNEYMQRR